MKKVLYIVIVLVLIAGGVWWYLSSRNTQEQMTVQGLGTYQYQCSGGIGFSMTPASDMSSIYIVPATGAAYAPQTLQKDESTTSAQYTGTSVSFSGKGETVTLTEGTSVTTCSPVTIPGEAPFNFGD